MSATVAMPSAWNIWPSRRSFTLQGGALKSQVGKVIAQSGLPGYEPETFAAIACLIQSQKLTGFVDVGANIGVYSLTMRAIFGRKISVSAFEPLPKLNSILRDLSDGNRLPVEIFDVALSNVHGTAEFYVSAKSDTSNSLNKDFRKSKGTVSVRTDTLTRMVANNASLRADLIKIDTESTEPDVIEGASGFIERHRPWIVCEVLAGRTEERLNALLKQHSYIPYHITDDELVRHEAISGDETYQFRDWIFAPDSISDATQKSFKKWRRAFDRVGHL